MVGKPQLFEKSYATVDRELDDERAHSMADEGGAYPARVEAQQPIENLAESLWPRRLALIVGVTVTGLVGYTIYRNLRERIEPAIIPL
jgi:hypothetical protein